MTIAHGFELVYYSNEFAGECVELGVNLDIISPVMPLSLLIFLVSFHMTLDLRMSILHLLVVYDVNLPCPF